MMFPFPTCVIEGPGLSGQAGVGGDTFTLANIMLWDHTQMQELLSIKYMDWIFIAPAQVGWELDKWMQKFRSPSPSPANTTTTGAGADAITVVAAHALPNDDVLFDGLANSSETLYKMAYKNIQIFFEENWLPYMGLKPTFSRIQGE